VTRWERWRLRLWRRLPETVQALAPQPVLDDVIRLTALDFAERAPRLIAAISVSFQAVALQAFKTGSAMEALNQAISDLDLGMTRKSQGESQS
jgi:hypothetical protein